MKQKFYSVLKNNKVKNWIRKWEIHVSWFLVNVIMYLKNPKESWDKYSFKYIIEQGSCIQGQPMHTHNKNTIHKKITYQLKMQNS